MLIRRRGFTLIELLVVIAIIAILAAILFPVFAQARAKARQATCTSNLKEIGLSVLMYVQDYDELFPTSWAKQWAGDANFFVQPYMKNVQILECPDYKVSVVAANAVCGPAANDPYGSYNLLPGQEDNPTGEPFLWGYGFNIGVQFNDGNGLQVQSGTPAPNGGQTITIDMLGKQIPVTVRPYPRIGVSQAQLGAPAQIFMEADSSEPPESGIEPQALAPVPDPNVDPSPCFDLLHANLPRHTKGNDFLYCDGHAKWQQWPGGKTNYGNEPASVANLCSYFASYDGTNDPGNCKTAGF